MMEVDITEFTVCISNSTRASVTSSGSPPPVQWQSTRKKNIGSNYKSLNSKDSFVNSFRCSLMGSLSLSLPLSPSLMLMISGLDWAFWTWPVTKPVPLPIQQLAMQLAQLQRQECRKAGSERGDWLRWSALIIIHIFLVDHSWKKPPAALGEDFAAAAGAGRWPHPTKTKSNCMWFGDVR